MSSSECAICRDLFDDAVLAADGFPYCRECILTWAACGNRDWRSPRSNELYKGHPVLRTDVERNCQARELRLSRALQSLRAGDANGDAVREALELTHSGRPLLGREQVSELVWDPAVLESPYLQLAVLCRSELLELLPCDSMQELCRMDRHKVKLPLLDMDVLRRLLREAVRRCTEERTHKHAVLLREVKEHFTFRAEASDAVELLPPPSPAARHVRASAVGLYFRDWLQSSPHHLIFVKGRGVGEQRLFLSVPLHSDSFRGCCEPQLLTRIGMLPFREASHEDDGVLETFSSEVLLTHDPGHWRRARGGLAFPDSRGQGDSEEEDWAEASPPIGCSSVLQKQLCHLPKGFAYHVFRNDPDHFYELKAELDAAHELLLALCEEGISTASRSTRKRQAQQMLGGENGIAAAG